MRELNRTEASIGTSSAPGWAGSASRAILLLAALVSLMVPVAAEATGCTAGPHSGTIIADERWCLADSPHTCSGNVTVAPGVTLTIEAGVVVQAPYRGGLTIMGALVVPGTEGQPVTFTGTQWTGLKFAGGTGTLAHCIVRDANWSDPCVTASGVPSPGLVLDHSTMGPSSYGLLVDGSKVTVTGCTFTQIGNDFPIRVRGESSSLSLSGNTFSGNGSNQVFLEPGAMTAADFTLVPQEGLDAYQVGAAYTIPSGRTVTLAAGVMVVAAYRSGLTVQGALVTQGTGAQPVTFTGPQWAGLKFAGGTGSLAHCIVRDANWSDPCITASGVPFPGLVLDHSTMGPSSYGLLVDGSKVTVTGCTFIQIGNDFPIRVRGESTSLSLSGNTFSGNGSNQVFLEPGAMTAADFTLVPQGGLDAYQVGSAYTIPSGRTVTLAAGVMVVSAYRSGLTIQGALVASGTEAQPVTFTGPQWTGLKFAGGTGTLAHCIVRDANWSDPCITASGVPAPGLVLDHSTIGPSSYGLLVDGSRVTVTGCTFTQIGNDFPIRVRGESSTLSLSRNTFSGNGSNQVFLEPGAMTGTDFTLVPQVGLDAYQVGVAYTIPSGRTVTLAAGVVVVAAYRSNLTVLGHLVTQGTGAHPVTFTGPQWAGLVFTGGTGDLGHAVIANAGFNSAGVTVTDVTVGEVRLDGCRVTSSASIVATNSHLTLVDTVVSDMRAEALWGIIAQSSSTLTAVHCTFARMRNGVSLTTGSTGTFTNTIVANMGAGVDADDTSHAAMTRTLWDTVVVQAPGNVTQEGALTGSAAFDADGYHLTPASMALGQGVLTTVREDIDGEARPAPVSSFPDLGADEMPYDTPASRSPVALTLGQAKDGTLTCGQYADFKLDLSEGDAPNLVVRLWATAGSPSWSLLGRASLLPTQAVYDAEGLGTPDGAVELLLPAPRAGTYYFSVLCSGGGAATFKIEAMAATRHLTSVSPEAGGNAGAVTLRLSGLGFEDGMDVSLRNGTDLRLSAPSAWDATSLTVRFDLAGLSAQAADVVARWEDGSEQALAHAFTIQEGGASTLKASIVVPASVRGLRSATLWLEYENTGTVDMPAPLFIVTSDQGLAMRHTSTEPWRREPLMVLGIDHWGAGSAGTLPPGSPQRVALRVFPEGAAHAGLTFRLSILKDGAGPVDWTAQEPYFRPEALDDALWTRLWGPITQALGTDWSDVQQRLREAADHISLDGRFEHRPAHLLAFLANDVAGSDAPDTLVSSTDAASPGPGPALAFRRVYPGSLMARFRLGAMGYGWTHNYNLRLSQLESGDVTIAGAGGLRAFRRLAEGIYQGGETDRGALAKDGDRFILTEPDGSVESFSADGALESVKDFLGNGATLSYDGSGRLTRVAHTDGDSLELTYDGAGRLHSLRDHAGGLTLYAYDGAGEHLESVTAPSGAVTSYAYEEVTGGLADHALLSVTRPGQALESFSYDELGRFSGRALDGQPTVTCDRPSLGVTRFADGTGRQATARWDEMGRLTSASAPGIPGVRLSFDESGNVKEATLGAGRTTQMEYGPLGETVSVTDPEGGTATTQWQHPSSGGSLLAGFTDAGGVAYQVERSGSARSRSSSSGAPSALLYPDGSREEFLRDATGLVSQYTNRRGQTVVLTRNARGQVTQRVFSDGTSASYEYDAQGRLTRATDASGSIVLTYATAGTLAGITYPGGHWFAFESDAAGRRTRRTSEDGFVLNYAYDSRGQLTQLATGAGQVLLAYTYDGAGRVISEERANGTVTQYTYDTVGRLVEVKHLAPGGAVADDVSYAYDSSGDLSSETSAEGTTTYAHDRAGRLIGVHYADGQTESYTYDGAGNRIILEKNGTATYYLINGSNQVLEAGSRSYAYDPDGNAISCSRGGSSTLLQYDALSRLTGATTSSGATLQYRYDALGQLAAVGREGAAASRFLYDGAGQAPAAELAAAGTLASRAVQGFGLAGTLDAAGAASYFHFDGAGNTREVTDGTGAVTGSYRYDPSGGNLETSGGGSNPYQFQGRSGDRIEAGGLEGIMMHLGEANYSTSLGRTTSVNPQRFSSGTNPYAPTGSQKAFSPAPCEYDMTGDVLNSVGTVLGLPSAPEPPKVFLGPEPGPGPGAVIGGALSIYSGYQGLSEMQSATEGKDKDWGAYSHGAGTTTLAGFSLLSMVCPPLAVPMFVTGCVVWAADSGTNLYIQSLGTHDMTKWYVPHNKWYYYNLNQRSGLVPPDKRKPIGDPTTTENVYSGDPNEKVGPQGRGPTHAVLDTDTLTYVIRFENVASASAPAQEVFVADALDPNLDLSTLRFGDVEWGDRVETVTSEGRSFHLRATVPDYRPGIVKVWWVDVAGELTDKGTLQWSLRTLDPDTGDLPEDALAGFLPPDDASGRGQGSVSFTIKPTAGLANGTQLANRATILFDQNAPIDTNTVLNPVGPPCTLTCDATGPAVGTAGQAASFTASVTSSGCPGTVAYDWSFGDGSAHSAAQSPNHTYGTSGSFQWMLTATVNGLTCTKSGTVTVVNGPSVALIKKASPPFKLVVTGSNLQSGIRVFIDGTEFTSVVWKNAGKIQLTGAIKAAVPKGTTHAFRFLNPDGGEASATWGW
jgi:YD repeat-containing protein